VTSASLKGSFGIYNYQGVGNPHLHANIQPNDQVLDVGCGLGIDSYIALRRVSTEVGSSNSNSNSGSVTGMDISSKEVSHANRCRLNANIPEDTLKFRVADMEQTNTSLLADNSFDVIISNGALCLSGDKEAALREMYRVLKPGGRISVWTSTVRPPSSSKNDDGDSTSTLGLDDTVEWPICMQMFIAQDKLAPLCESVGFENVWLDDTDDLMAFDLEECECDEQQETPDTKGGDDDDDAGDDDGKDISDAALNPERKRVHATGTNPAFKHLERYDMNELCARVCLVATKPN
jgi:SAM-dependent methyltransferase